jgi:hypothetical protein
VLGLIYWIAAQLLPHPWPGVIVAVCVLILLIAFVGDVNLDAD